MTDPKHCIEICNKLLRGERSAVETYDKAIEKYGDQPVLGELRAIRADHAEAVLELESNVRSMGGEPAEESGAWGALANTVQSTANLFGASSAIEALQSGEKSGQSDYKGALEDEKVMEDCKTMIRLKLLPKIDTHIVTLEALQKAS